MLSSLSPAQELQLQQPANAALRKQAQGLEGVFLNMLTSQMFSSIKTDGTFGGGFGEQTWRGMQSEQMADAIAKSGGIGLADNITRNLLDMQEAAQRTNGNAPTGNAQGENQE